MRRRRDFAGQKLRWTAGSSEKIAEAIAAEGQKGTARERRASANIQKGGLS
jgi:hypothetical protein